MKLETELMRGAGPLAVLKLLESGERYGYELIEALSQQSNGVLAMGQSTLYPMLYNLEAKKLLASRVDKSGPRPRKYYRLTKKGQKRLSRDSQQWLALLQAMTALGVVDPSEVSNAPQLGGANS